MELALIENLQRKDLSAFEEADGLKTLAENFGYTHEQMADRIGKSRTSITEVLSLAAMPEDVRERCRRADIHSKSLLLQIVRQGDPRKMVVAPRRPPEGRRVPATRARRLAKAGKAKGAKGRPRNYVFRYQPREKSFNLSLQFRKAQVPREEVVRRAPVDHRRPDARGRLSVE